MSPLRVLLDATAIPADRGGVGRYVEELVGALEGVELVLACQARDADRFARLAPGATLRPQSTRLARVPFRLLWEQFGLPRLARGEAVDVIHSPHYTVPLLTRVARVVTFHDATFFSDPSVHTLAKRLFFRLWIRLASQLARIVVVPSVATADEIQRWTKTHAELRVAPHGVDRRVFRPVKPQERESLADRLGAEHWIAFLGTIEPRKNIPALIAAYGLLVADGRADVPALVLAGAPGWDDKVGAAVARVPPAGRVIIAGYLPINDLPALLGGADLVAYPSLGEGFGLPVLEAMACGAAVLTTRRLALPEVGGDAVAYAEPDPASLAAALGSLLDDPERRSALGRAALERAQSFTWERTAGLHVDAWRKAAE